MAAPVFFGSIINVGVSYPAACASNALPFGPTQQRGLSPARVKEQVFFSLNKKTAPADAEAVIQCRHRPIFPGRRQPSIVGTGELNFRVRNGNGWTLTVISTDCESKFITRL